MKFNSNVHSTKRTTKRNGKFVKQNLRSKQLDELEDLPKNQKIKPRRGGN